MELKEQRKWTLHLELKDWRELSTQQYFPYFGCMIFTMFLVIHITASSIALISGAISAISIKGSKPHKQSGRFFVPSMIGSTSSALILSFMHPNYFLMGIGLFSLYLTLAGWIWVRRATQLEKAKHTKWLGIAGLIFGAVLIVISLIKWPALNIVALIFGLVQLFFAGMAFRPGKDVKGNIARHGALIGGAYIATFTAFLVVNFSFLPFYVSWLLPSLIGTVLLTMRIRKWNNAIA